MIIEIELFMLMVHRRRSEDDITFSAFAITQVGLLLVETSSYLHMKSKLKLFIRVKQSE